MGAEWDVFCEAVAGLGHEMIFLDTQARITPGAGEIDRVEQSELVEACDRLRVATGACVVLIHHRGAAGVHARGHTEVIGALQTQVYVEKSANRIIVGARQANGGKTKDDREPADIVFQLIDVPIIGKPDENGIIEPGRHKGVLQWLDGAISSEEKQQEKLNAEQRRARALWRVIVDEFNPADGGSRADFRAHFYDVPEIAALKPDGRRKAFQRAWSTLIGLGLVAKHFKSARFKIVEVVDQAADGVLTANPDQQAGGVGRLNSNWELWTNDMESADALKL